MAVLERIPRMAAGLTRHRQESAWSSKIGAAVAWAHDQPQLKTRSVVNRCQVLVIFQVAL